MAQLLRELNVLGEWAQLLVTGRGTTLARVASEGGIPVAGTPWRFGLDPRAVALALRGISSAASRSVVHVHDSHALALGIVAARLARVPLIATRRSTTVAGPAWRVPDRVLAISGAVREALLAAGVSHSRIAVVPSGVDLATLGPAIHDAEEHGNTDLIAVGALTREKGHATLLQAFAQVVARHPGATLTILGDGPERASLERLALELGVHGRARLPGEATTPAPQVARAIIMVQPSLREALGTAVLEAMAVGTPVVASAVGGLSGLLAGDAGVLVPPGDPGALATAIIRLIEDPERRASLRRAAWQRVREYDIRGMAERCAQVYRSALDQPGH